MHKQQFLKGFKLGIPIGLGYFAVSFSLGIVASNAGLTAIQGLIASLVNNASAGESAGFIGITENVTYWEMIIITIVTNCRYILMSFSLSQKINPNEKLIHRLILGFLLTDEFFGIAIDQDGYCDPYISYGAFSIATPLWAIGTALGIIMGNILPLNIVSCLSVALYGMFLAIIIPPAKKNKRIALLVIISFVSSYLLSRLTDLSSSWITIILTVAIASLAAIIFPVKGDDNNEE